MVEFSVSPENSKARLLIVDDEINVRSTLGEFLEQRGITLEKPGLAVRR